MNAQSFFVPVFSGSLNTQTELLCNARDLHKVLQVGRKFATWIVERIKEYGFIENQDFVLVSRNGEIKKGRGGDRRSIDYHLTLDMAKELAMVEKTEVGRQVRRYFIQCEQERYGNLNRQAQIAHTISAEEAERISEKVLERCGRTGETFQKVYRGLHEYLGVDSYHHIPASMFATAMRYLDSLPQAPELFRQPEAAKLRNLKAALHHGLYCAEFIYRHSEALRGLNRRLAAGIHDHATAAIVSIRSVAGQSETPLPDGRYFEHFPWDGDCRDKARYNALFI